MKDLHDYRVDFTTSKGNGGYIVISAKSNNDARKRAWEQIILGPGEQIVTLSINGPCKFQ